MTEMKNSGIEWFGDIPSTWQVTKYKYVMRPVKNLKAEYQGEDILSLTMNGVVKRDLVNPSGKMPASFDGYQIIEKENLVAALFDIDVTPRTVGIAKDNGLTSPAYTQFEVETNEDVRYWYYQWLYMDNEKTLVSMTKSLRNTLTASDFGQLPTILPPYEEQVRIADYLDAKTRQIDGLISDTEKSIVDMKMYLQSIITDEINKYRSQNVRLKFLISEPLKYGATESGVEFDSDLYRYIRITDISKNGKLKDSNKLSLTLNQAEGYELIPGDVLFARSGGTVGKSFLFDDAKLKAAFAGYLIRARLNKSKILPEYLYLYTLSSGYEAWKDSIFVKATIQNIGADKYANLPVPVPETVAQQRIIIETLLSKKNAIENLISKKEQIITELKEYKQSLIYETVTGKGVR